ncbi:N/A [soil metagenome]
MRRVVLLDAQIKRYRVPFLRQLAAALAPHDISFVVGYSGPTATDHERADTIEIEPELGRELPIATFLNGRVVVQPAWRLVRDADLVIIGQANGLIFNYALLALSRLGVTRVAYWGHGYNHQAPRSGISEWIKRKLINRVDGWFPYTPEVARYLVEHGVPEAKITTIYNTIDVVELRAAIAQVDRAATRASLGIAPGSRIAIYCGALVPEKQIAFMIESAIVIRTHIPDFELVIVGAGRERARIDALAQPFVHAVGPSFGAERARYFAIADLCLLPAHAGLAVVDAFAAGLPVVTTDHLGHGPELEYLTPFNSRTTAFTIASYAEAIAGVLASPAQLVEMKAAARHAADQLSMQRMVDAFVTGILRCLA